MVTSDKFGLICSYMLILSRNETPAAKERTARIAINLWIGHKRDGPVTEA